MMRDLLTMAIPSKAADAALTEAFRYVNAVDTLLRLQERVFTPADLERLGPDLNKLYYSIGVTGIWMKLRGCTLARAVIDIYYSLGAYNVQTREWLLREIGEGLVDSETAIERAVQSAVLVLLDCPRTAYFQGTQLEVDWQAHSAPWEHLELLAKKTKAGDVLDRVSLGVKASENLPKRRKENLRRLQGMPPALVDLIVSAGSHSQRLDLRAPQICVFEHVGSGNYREWMP